MSTFSARLRLPGRTKLPLSVEVDIQHERMTLTSGDRTVGVWPLADLEVVSQSDGFHIKLDGDEVVLNVAESKRFAAALGINEHTRRLVAVPTHHLAPSMIESEEDQVMDLERRVAEVTEALVSETLTPAAAFAQWLNLLKEINLRHGQGSMPTDVFYRLNSALLDLIPEPASVTEQIETAESI